MFADAAAGLDVLVADFGGAGPGGLVPAGRGQRANGLVHLRERPGQVHRRWSCRKQAFDRRIEPGVRSVLAQRQADAIGGRGADQRRAAHLHGPDRMGGLLEAGQPRDLDGVGQQGLVDDLDIAGPVGGGPDRARWTTIDQHGALQ